MGQSAIDASEIHAIVIGISTYRQLMEAPEAPEAVYGAVDFAKWLLEGGVPARNFHLHLTENNGDTLPQGVHGAPASREAIDESFKSFIRTPPDRRLGRRIYIYIAGLGVTVAADQEEVFLLLPDAAPTHFSAIGIKGYADAIAASGTFDDVILFADCSRDTRPYFDLPITSPFPQFRNIEPGVTYFYAFAARAGKVAFFVPKGEERRGVFTSALLDALRGDARGPDGTITTGTLESYLQNRMGSTAELQNGDYNQTPEFKRNTDGSFILVTAPTSQPTETNGTVKVDRLRRPLRKNQLEDVTEDPLSDSRKANFGVKILPRRSAAADELTADVESLASAIASTFVAAADDDDFIFALYGRWGRGKTTLIKQVARLLEGKGDATPTLKRYRFIHFSAWKYPTRPEVWVHLYQKIASAAETGNPWQKVRIAFRTGLLKNGWWPLWAGFGLLAVSRLQLDFASWMFDGIGLIGLLIIGSFIWNTTKIGKRLAHSYLSMPDHAEKLGLQAVIGQDLNDLLTVWIHSPTLKAEAKSRRAAVCDFTAWGKARLSLLLVVLLIWSALALTTWKLYRHQSPVPTDATVVVTPATGPQQEPAAPARRIEIELSGIPSTQAGPPTKNSPEAGDMEKIPAPLVLLYWLLAAAALLAATLAIQIAKRPKQHQCVFLVVDDLDRCEPDQMLAVIESIRLFLDEAEMSRRLQVAMLLDREIFIKAVANKGIKAGILMDPANDHDGHDCKMRERFCREQEEKLFVASVELPPFAADQLKELAEKIVGREYASQRETAPSVTDKANDQQSNSQSTGIEASPLADEVEFINVKLPTIYAKNKSAFEEAKKRAEELPKQLLHTEPRRRVDPLENDGIVFHADERRMLTAAIELLDPATITPRSLRSFILRYQLVRLILRELYGTFEPQQVITALAEKLFEIGSSKTPAESRVQNVIDMVTWRKSNTTTVSTPVTAYSQP